MVLKVPGKLGFSMVLKVLGKLGFSMYNTLQNLTKHAAIV